MGECWVETDEKGRVVNASEQAAALFNLSARGLQGRNLLLFFPEHRILLQRESDLARRGGKAPPINVTLRPRERKAFPITVRLSVRPAGTVRWELSVPHLPSGDAPDRASAIRIWRPVDGDPLDDELHLPAVNPDGFDVERFALAAERRALHEEREALHTRVVGLASDRRPEVVIKLSNDLRAYSDRLNALHARIDDFYVRLRQSIGVDKQ